MDLQTLANSSFGVGLATRLPGLLPARVGRALGVALADLTASRRNSTLVRTVRANQWIARGGRPTDEELDRIVRRVLRHRTRCVFDLYHAIHRPEELARLSPPDAEMARIIERYCRASANEGAGRPGVVIAAPHLSNWDLVMLASAARGLRAQVLAHPNPEPGYLRHYRIWASRGMEITPSSLGALRQATKRLRDGGIVIVGVDRVVSEMKQMISFFGHPSPLPVAHVRLALATGAPVIPFAAQMLADGTYAPRFGDPIPLVRVADADKTVRLNAEAVLSVMERFISQTPDQWLMFNPVWPDAPEPV